MENKKVANAINQTWIVYENRYEEVVENEVESLYENQKILYGKPPEGTRMHLRREAMKRHAPLNWACKAFDSIFRPPEATFLYEDTGEKILRQRDEYIENDSKKAVIFVEMLNSLDEKIGGYNG